MSKQCKKCNQIKGLSCFGKRTDSKDGYRHDCKECVSQRVRVWGQNNFWKNRAKSFNNGSGRRNGKAGDIIRNSEPVSEKDLEKLFQNAPYCNYCKVRLEKEKIIFEHKIPLSRGGNHCICNICISCHDCNQLKGTRTEDEFLKFILNYIVRFR